MNRLAALLTGLIVLTTVLAAVAGALLGLEPARAWTADEGHVVAAPTAQAPGGIGATELVAARRAAGEAASQAGLLTTGTADLAAGTKELSDGTSQLLTGIDAAAEGAHSLSGGMAELQAGVGQLGSGATQVANGVESATAPLVGMGAVRGQIVGSIDRAVAALEGATDPDLVKAREDLLSVRAQAVNIPLDENALADVTALRDGARELANQLAVPGYAFHDGVFTATQGAKDLAAGLTELDAGSNTAGEAIDSLAGGAQQIDTLAINTDAKIDEINRAIPAPAWGVASEEKPSQRVLAPQIALLIAALVMLVGSASAVGASLLPRRRWLIVGAGTLGAVLSGVVALLVFGGGFGVATVVGAAGLFALSALASAGITAVVLVVAGPAWGSVIAGTAGIVQLAIAGVVWRVAASSEVTAGLKILADLLPLHWATTSLTAVGNDGSPVSLWVGAAVLGALAVIGGLGLGMSRKGVE